MNDLYDWPVGTVAPLTKAAQVEQAVLINSLARCTAKHDRRLGTSEYVNRELLSF
jgi:hypothetical protein